MKRLLIVALLTACGSKSDKKSGSIPSADVQTQRVSCFVPTEDFDAQIEIEFIEELNTAYEKTTIDLTILQDGEIVGQDSSTIMASVSLEYDFIGVSVSDGHIIMETSSSSIFVESYCTE